MVEPDENQSGNSTSEPQPEIGRVVMLSGSFPPMPCGVGDSAHQLAHSLAGLGLDITALTDIHADSCEPGQCPVPTHATIEKWGLGATKRIARAIEELEPDILHIHYPSKGYGRGLGVPFLPMTIRSRRKRFKIVLTLHEFKLSHSLRKQAGFILLDPCDAVVMPCPLELAALVRRHRSVEEMINAAIPVGPVRPFPDEFTEEERQALRLRFRTDWGVGEDDVVLLHYGTPTPSKGIEVLFKALRILKLEDANPHLVIAGDFRPYEDDFHKLLSGQPGGLGIRDQVRWLGRLPTEDLAGAFLASDIGVFPFLDGFSFRRSSLTGVLNWNLPIITTRPDGDLPEILDQDKVRFVKAGNPGALATALLPLIANPKALRNAKDAPNPLMRYFQWDRIAKEYIDIYHQVLKL